MKVKKILCIAAVVMFLLTVFISPVYAANRKKNETVYGILDYDGSVKNVYVVNQLIGDYEDYGSYSEIKNLSSNSIPTVTGEKITFPDESIQGGLYYQGTMEAELPMTVAIRYYLDGKNVSAQSLGGSSGHLKIEIDYAVNKNCDERLTDGIMAQIMFSLNMDLATNINYYDGTSVIVGNTMTVTYMSLFEEDGTAKLEADITNFEMDGISISLLKGAFSMDEYKDTIDEFKEGFTEMQDGADDLIDGTTELQGGMKSLVSGVWRVYDGMSQIEGAGEEIKQGNSEYAAGLNEFTNGVSGLAGGSSEVLAGLNQLSENGSAVAGGVAQASDALAALSSSSSDLVTLAQALAAHPDPNVQALAAGTLQTLGAVDGISDGLSAASGGVQSYIHGVSDAAAGYSVFDSGVQQLSSNSFGVYSGFEQIALGFNSYLSGINESADGILKLYYAVDDLPDDIQILLDGQQEFKDGINEASDELNNETEVLDVPDDVVSFASPDKNKPDSVQYVLITPDIELPEEPEPVDETEETDNFFTRLIDLFS